MPHSRIASAQLTPDADEVTVTGPMDFGADEAGTDVLSIHFVLLRGADFAHGTTVTNGGATKWSETVPVFGKFDAGDDVDGFGVAVLLSPKDPDSAARIVQTITWSERVTISAA